MVWEQTVLEVNGPWGERYGSELSWGLIVLGANGMGANCPGSERFYGQTVWERPVMGMNSSCGEQYAGELSWKGTVLGANGMGTNCPGGERSLGRMVRG